MQYKHRRPQSFFKQPHDRKAAFWLATKVLLAFVVVGSFAVNTVSGCQDDGPRVFVQYNQQRKVVDCVIVPASKLERYPAWCSSPKLFYDDDGTIIAAWENGWIQYYPGGDTESVFKKINIDGSMCRKVE